MPGVFRREALKALAAAATAASGLLPPQTVSLSREGTGPVTVKWDTAYAAGEPLSKYEIYRRDEKLATVPFKPQISEDPFTFVDDAAPAGNPGGLWYKVRAVDSKGEWADSNSVKPV